MRPRQSSRKGQPTQHDMRAPKGRAEAQIACVEREADHEKPEICDIQLHPSTASTFEEAMVGDVLPPMPWALGV